MPKNVLPIFRCCVLLLLAACTKPSATAAAGPDPAQKTRFCNGDLSGYWINASDRHYAYRFRDQGGMVSGEYMVAEDDGGLSVAPQPILFELRRTDTAIAGVMKADGPSASGRMCNLEFGVQVSSCEPEAMIVVAETEAFITDECKPRRAEDGGQLHPALSAYRFERLHPPGGDAGR